MNKEEKFLNIISKTLSNSGFLGDDCAYIKKYNLVVSTDTLIENVHFRKNTTPPRVLGKKALLVNISDILASGAKPEYVTISLSGNLDIGFIKELYSGVDEICNKYGIKVIGGDLTGGDKTTVSMTILGNTNERNVSSRKNAKPGYIALLAGEAGSSTIGLRFLEGLKVPDDIQAEKRGYFIQKHLEPDLCPKISETIAFLTKHPYAMMDTSDGLFDALKKVSEASGVGFSINFNNILRQTNDFNTVMFGGEDFGLLICLFEEDFKEIWPKINKIDGEKASIIGRVTEGNMILVDNKEVLGDFRYEHF